MTTIRTSKLGTSLHVAILQLSVLAFAAMLTLRTGLQHRVSEARKDAERGEISSTTVIVAMLVALALAVGLLITDRIQGKADSIVVDG